MSYRRPRWLADYTDRALFTEQPSANSRPTASPPVEALAQAGEVLVATSSVGTCTGAAVLDTVYRLPQGTIAASKLARATARPDVTTTEASSQPRLLDSAGTVLVEQFFEFAEISDETGPRRVFCVAMAYHPASTRVVVAPTSQALGARPVSTRTLGGRVLTPNGGETLADPLSIAWEADDPDGEPPRYTVHDRPDRGATWQVLALDYLSRTLAVDTQTLPGSQGLALVRVIADDGVNAAIDQPDQPFTMRSTGGR